MLEIFCGIVGIIFLIVMKKSIYLVRQSEAILIERLGRYHKTLTAGIHVVIPFVDDAHYAFWTYVLVEDHGKRYSRYNQIVSRIDLREAVYDFPKQSVITKDNVNIDINALLYYQITDPRAALYEISNLPEAIEKITQTTLRNVIGSMDLDETLVSRDSINTQLRLILDEATDKWGVKINRVELQEVNPPRDIQQAMEKQMRAERDRRAIILESEGKKRAAILQAEGDQEAEILRAQGCARARVLEAESQAEARMKVAQAEATAIEMVAKAVPGDDAASYLIAEKYITAFSRIVDGKDDKLVVVPYEATNLVGALSLIKKVMQKAE